MPREPGDSAAARRRQHTFWLATRGAQQMDLAIRFASSARARNLPVLALKGISIADELYGGMENRPMADVDFLVVETSRFEEAAEAARFLGLVETGASDHALVFKEEASGVVLELHISLTACPGLFGIDNLGLWKRRTPVGDSPMFRLSDEDLVIHLALHTAFQHTFVASDSHYDDFMRVLDSRRPDPDRIVELAKTAGALGALGAMCVACVRRGLVSPALQDLVARTAAFCPKAVERWIAAQGPTPPPFRLRDMAFLRFRLAPSRVRFARATLFPARLPGRVTRGPGALQRLIGLFQAGGAGGASEPPRPPDSIPERTVSPDLAEPWIRECLSLDRRGAELTVTGTCMEPAIRDGARVRLRPPDPPARVGDVALLRTAKGLRLHRVVLRIGSVLRTKGDAGIYLDPPSSRGDVIAILAGAEPRWRGLLFALSSLLRLFTRPWTTAARGAGRGDAEHARLLP